MTTSVVVVAYGAMPLLSDALGALLQADGVDEIVVVDNGMDEDTRASLPTEARVVIAGDGANLGFAGGCNAGVAVSRGEIVAFVNPDLVVEPSAIASLRSVAERAGVGFVTGQVRLAGERERLNAAGGVLHFTGLGWSQHFGDPVAAAGDARPSPIMSGALAAVRREVFDDVGGFADELFLYHEDAELSLRAWLRGYENRFEPSSIGWHHYEFSRNLAKLYHLERNRLYVLAVCFPLRAVLLALPALLLYELGIVAVAAKEGWLRDKARGWLWLARHRSLVRERRVRAREACTRSDREFASLLAEHFDAGNYELSRALRAADRVLSRYWRAVRRFA